MDLPTMRARVRRDLHDEGSNPRWTDDEVDRHVQRAVAEVSLAAPRERTATLLTTAGSRDLSLATVTDLLTVEAVEYPAGQYPPCYARYSLWGATLTLLVDSLPQTQEDVKLYYGASHALGTSASTLPAQLEDVVASGAGAYAALEWANYAINRVNAGGEEVWRQYLAWGQDRLAAYQEALRKLGGRNTVRVRSLYAPANALPGQATDTGAG